MYIYFCWPHVENVHTIIQGCSIMEVSTDIEMDIFSCSPPSLKIYSYNCLPLNRVVYVYITVFSLMELYIRQMTDG